MYTHVRHTKETHPNPPCEGGDSDIAEFQVLPHREDLGGSRALFHLIIQMQREGAIRFTQLIAEKGYRWLHISYVPGMLRNQIIDVNVNVNANDNLTSGGVNAEEPMLTLTSSLALKKEYQDSG